MLSDCCAPNLLLFVKMPPCLVAIVVGRCGVELLTTVNLCPLGVVKIVDDLALVGVRRTCRRMGVDSWGVCMSCASNRFRKLIFGDWVGVDVVNGGMMVSVNVFTRIGWFGFLFTKLGVSGTHFVRSVFMAGLVPTLTQFEFGVLC